MLGLVLAMIICVGLAVAVVVIVAMPARREGRDILAARGGEVVERREDGSTDAVDAADGSSEVPSGTGDRTGELLGHQAD